MQCKQGSDIIENRMKMILTADIRLSIPGILDRLSQWETVKLKLHVADKIPRATSLCIPLTQNLIVSVNCPT